DRPRHARRGDPARRGDACGHAGAHRGPAPFAPRTEPFQSRPMSAESVLIAEDSVTQALLLQNMLEKNGFSVTVAHNGREALEALARSRPTLVISDIQMPEVDGYE